MAVYSYNGWLASADPKDFGGLDNRVIPGTNSKLAPGVRAGDVATVLFYVAEQLHLRVEPITDYAAGDDWGYFYRPNVNDVRTWSCHASATAFDYNATQHPNGKKNTWTTAQYAEIDRILAEVSNVVRHLRGTDEMHFEICALEPQVAAVAQRLRSRKPATTLRLQRGSRGLEVKELQRVLNTWYPNDPQLELDGRFGPATEAAVKRMQTRAGIDVDGIAGPITLGRLGLA